MARVLTKAAQQSLMVDSRRQGEEAATEISSCLEISTGETDPCGAYAILKFWYWHTSAWVPNPSWTNIKEVRGDFQIIYQREEPHTPVIPLATHLDPVQVNYATPSDAEV